jgi:hypothetical protein
MQQFFAQQRKTMGEASLDNSSDQTANRQAPNPAMQFANMMQYPMMMGNLDNGGEQPMMNPQ